MNWLNEELSAEQQEQLNVAKEVIKGMEGVEIELCGYWLWVRGNTRPYKDIFKASGFRWAPKKEAWTFCAGRRTTSRGKFSMGEIRMRHGSERM